MFKVWDVDSSIPPDYIQIVTGTAIDPADIDLTVGDVICFGSPLVTQEGRYTFNKYIHLVILMFSFLRVSNVKFRPLGIHQ